MNSDTKYFKKLGVNSFCDLALLLPKSYENNFITKAPLLNQQNSIEIEVLSSHKGPKALTLKLFCKTWSEKLNAIIFRPSAYHLTTFRVGTTLHVKGKLIYSQGFVQLQQPKVLKEINTINTKYKTSIPNAMMQKLIKKYLKEDNLKKEGIGSKDIQNLLLLHFPTLDFLTSFTKDGFSKDMLRTLKYVEIRQYLKSLEKKSLKFEAKSKLESPIESFVQSLPFELTKDQKKQ